VRILSIDVGEKNIGLAMSDELGWTAQGFSCLRGQSRAEAILGIADVIKEHGVSEVVVGMPVSLDGSLGKKAKEVAVFIEELKKKIGVPVKVWDERFSSLQAEKVMLEADLSRKKRKKKIDVLAAQLILQSYLDKRCEDVRKDNLK
jgi:putative Holliday junction resolvase